ncbi:MAG: hydantoinase/oxoprolinase family protein, partial [Chloroflexi bacterium]|nr:hydantoinase/oxoprolinase family protein [Chloroflexota bacterium]
MSLRIGIDVGGTNTDAVLMAGLTVVAKIKTPTSPDVTSGITTALRHILETSATRTSAISGVMIGTTHFTNAVVERRRLEPTAALRLGLPATAALPPMVDWPEDLANVLGHHTYLCHGGHEFDGREISPLAPEEVRGVAQEITEKGITAVAVSSVFSPVDTGMEQEAAAIIRETVPGAQVTLSCDIGR